MIYWHRIKKQIKNDIKYTVINTGCQGDLDH